MKEQKSPLPDLYKGIVLFTPGGDVIYTIDPNKQERWHLHLCLGLQETLGLPEPPHFLIPAYTATIDQWLDRDSGEIKVSAELQPFVKRYLPLLQVLFNHSNWSLAPWQEEYCNPEIIETYRASFPQLWQANELFICLKTETLHHRHPQLQITNQSGSLPKTDQQNQKTTQVKKSGYVLRLYISNNHIATQTTLDNIHKILEQELIQPYTLKIIDISKNPEQAEQDQIQAIPALVRVWPKPVKKIIGDLDDLTKVLKIISS